MNPPPRAVLLDFYGAVVEVDDRIVATIRDEIAAALRTRVTVGDMGA